MAERKRWAILDFIRRYLEEKKRPPTNKEIADGVGYKTASAVTDQLKRLERDGLIKREPHVARGLQLTDKSSKPNESEDGD